MPSSRAPSQAVDIPPHQPRSDLLSVISRLSSSAPSSSHKPRTTIRRKPSVIGQYVSHARADVTSRPEHQNPVHISKQARDHGPISIHGTSLPLQLPSFFEQSIMPIPASHSTRPDVASQAATFDKRNTLSQSAPSHTRPQATPQLPATPTITFSRQPVTRIPVELAHLDRDAPTPRPPRRPSRDGVPPLTPEHDRIRSQSARMASPSIRPSPTPSTGSRTIRRVPSHDRLGHTSSSTSLKAYNMIGKLLGRDIESLSKHSRPRGTRKGPAARTGHEGYSRFGCRFRDCNHSSPQCEHASGSPISAISESTQSPLAELAQTFAEMQQPTSLSNTMELSASPSGSPRPPRPRLVTKTNLSQPRPVDVARSAPTFPQTFYHDVDPASASASPTLGSSRRDAADLISRFARQHSLVDADVSPQTMTSSHVSPISTRSPQYPVMPLYELPGSSPDDELSSDWKHSGDIPVLESRNRVHRTSRLLDLSAHRFELPDNGSSVSSSLTTGTSILEADTCEWYGDEDTWEEYNDILGLAPPTHSADSDDCRSATEEELRPPPERHDSISETTSDCTNSRGQNIRLGALMTSRWLANGRIMLSPIERQMAKSRETKVLIIDGNSDDWSIFCAMSYPHATVYNLQPQSPGYTVLNGHEKGTPEAIPNHRSIRHPVPTAPYPFPQDFFDAVVYRFPTAAAALAHDVAECKRVVRPGGFVEMCTVDVDPLCMGVQTRKALREQKMAMAETDRLSNVGADVVGLLAGVGMRGLQRCTVGVPVSVKGVETKRTSSTETKFVVAQDGELASLLRDSPGLGNESDEEIADMVVRVGRWWYTNCYGTAVGGGPGLWDRPGVLDECRDQGTTLRLCLCFAQKPASVKRRTVSF